jgi:hypothetical protein
VCSAYHFILAVPAVQRSASNLHRFLLTAKIVIVEILSAIVFLIWVFGHSWEKCAYIEREYTATCPITLSITVLLVRIEIGIKTDQIGDRRDVHRFFEDVAYLKNFEK